MRFGIEHLLTNGGRTAQRFDEGRHCWIGWTTSAAHYYNQFHRWQQLGKHSMFVLPSKHSQRATLDFLHVAGTAPRPSPPLICLAINVASVDFLKRFQEAIAESPTHSVDSVVVAGTHSQCIVVPTLFWHQKFWLNSKFQVIRVKTGVGSNSMLLENSEVFGARANGFDLLMRVVERMRLLDLHETMVYARTTYYVTYLYRIDPQRCRNKNTSGVFSLATEPKSIFRGMCGTTKGAHLGLLL